MQNSDIIQRLINIESFALGLAKEAEAARKEIEQENAKDHAVSMKIAGIVNNRTVSLLTKKDRPHPAKNDRRS